jgi:hypothetical protein
VQAGAGWRLRGDSVFGHAPNYTRSTPTNGAVLEFATNVFGWNPPPSQTVQLTAGSLTTIPNQNYSVKPPSVIYDPALGIGITGTTNTIYILERSLTLQPATWLTIRTNFLATSPGFFGPLTNTPAAFYRVRWPLQP